MKYLLDTCALILFFEDSVKLGEAAADIIEDTFARKYVSVVSLWEFAIKHGAGKLKFDGGLPQFHKLITQNGFTVLPITLPHLEQLIRLPNHHRDPFDRLLVATAQTGGMTIVTRDESIPLYAVRVLW